MDLDGHIPLSASIGALLAKLTSTEESKSETAKSSSGDNEIGPLSMDWND